MRGEQSFEDWVSRFDDSHVYLYRIKRGAVRSLKIKGMAGAKQQQQLVTIEMQVEIELAQKVVEVLRESKPSAVITHGRTPKAPCVVRTFKDMEDAEYLSGEDGRFEALKDVRAGLTKKRG